MCGGDDNKDENQSLLSSLQSIGELPATGRFKVRGENLNHCHYQAK